MSSDKIQFRHGDITSSKNWRAKELVLSLAPQPGEYLFWERSMSWEKALEELGQIARLEVVLGKRVGYEKWRDASRDPKSPIFIGLTSFRRFGLGRESSSVQLQTLTCWIIFNVNEFVRDIFVAVGKLALRLFFFYWMGIWKRMGEFMIIHLKKRIWISVN